MTTRTRRAAAGRRARRLALWAAPSALLLAGTLIYADVQGERRRICAGVGEAPARPVAIVFGAAGDVLADRVATGAAL